MYWHVIWHIFWKLSHDIDYDKSFDISSDSLSDIAEVLCKRQLPKWVFGRRSGQKTIEIWPKKNLETPGKVVVKTNQKQTLVLDWSQESGRSFNFIFSPDFLARCFIVWRLQEANLWIRTSSECERVFHVSLGQLQLSWFVFWSSQNGEGVHLPRNSRRLATEHMFSWLRLY